jgi:predicted nucleic acid-binding protein
VLLVVDANIVISVLISSGKKQDLLFSDEISAVSPDWLLFEIGKHWSDILKKSGLSEEDMMSAFAFVREQIETFSLDKISDKFTEAKEVCPHLSDVEYFALALKLNCAIWSEDKELKRQDKVKVLNTKELSKLFELSKKKPKSEDIFDSEDKDK